MLLDQLIYVAFFLYFAIIIGTLAKLYIVGVRGVYLFLSPLVPVTVFIGTFTMALTLLFKAYKNTSHIKDRFFVTFILLSIPFETLPFFIGVAGELIKLVSNNIQSKEIFEEAIEYFKSYYQDRIKRVLLYENA